MGRQKKANQGNGGERDKEEKGGTLARRDGEGDMERKAKVQGPGREAEIWRVTEFFYIRFLISIHEHRREDYKDLYYWAEVTG